MPSRRADPRTTRRAFLHAGGMSWLGLAVDDVLRRRACPGGTSGSGRPVRGVILAFCTGGISQLDTFDPKPDAPLEIRGGFGTVATALPGVRVCEHLPGLARRLGRAALVRSMTTPTLIHEPAAHRIFGGVNETPAGTGTAASRSDRPHLGALAAAVAPGRSPAGLPHSVVLPTRLNFEGSVFPGQNAGFLGPRFDPWHLVGDPTDPDFGPTELTLPEGLTPARLDARSTLLAAVEAQRREMDRRADSPTAILDHARRRAAELLASRRCRDAFDLAREDPRLRDRYGRTMMGQGLLLGRRLVEAGVPLVQVNLGESNLWDTHANNFGRLKDGLLPPFDRAVSALMDDLDARGLWDEVLVVVTGEFGRTPRIGVVSTKDGAGATPDGRDHWGSVFTLLAFGGGVGRGRVLGASNRLASHPASAAYSPADLGATILSALGVDPRAEVHDRLGRPFPVNLGTPIPWS
jgi:hypothetical protein